MNSTKIRAARILSVCALVTGLAGFASSQVAAPDAAKGSDRELGYYNGAGPYYPVAIDVTRISIRFDDDYTGDAIRAYLSGVAEIDASHLGELPVSEERSTIAPLRPGVTEGELLHLTERLDRSPGILYAMPVLDRAGEMLGLNRQLMVSFYSGLTSADAAELFTVRGLAVVERLDYVEHGYLLALPKGSGKLTLDESVWFHDTGLTEWAVPDFVVERVARYTPNDIYYQYQWHLHATGQGGSKVDADIDAPEAWNVTQGDASITVAIIDDGVESSHQDLSANATAGWDFLGNDSNPSPGSGDNHGTAVCGVACARGSNSVGVTGVAPKCRFMPLRLVGFGQTTAKEASAISYAKNNGADVMNNSWGPPDGTGQFYPLPANVKAAIDDAVNNGRNGKGCVIFWAAGNGNESADLDGYASYGNVISVAASTDQDLRAGYSDFGSTVDICAPSNGGGPWGIVTVDRTGSAGYSTGDYASGFGGTSAASPVAAGVAALVLSKNPDLTFAQVYNVLTSTADKIDAAGGNYNGSGHSTKYGFGKVNARDAVNAAGTPGGDPDPDPDPDPGGFVTFTSSDVPKAIPDNSSQGTFSNLSVSGMSGSLTDVDCTVNIGHTYKGDLLVYLQRPDGSYILMHNKTGGGANDINTTYDTQTTPFQPMSNLLGGSPNGNWRLWAFDQAAQDVGAINGWSLHVQTDAGGGGGGPTTITYNATDLPKAIPDNNTTGVTSGLFVSGQSGNITEVNVSVNITHTWKGDLIVTAIHPGGTAVILHNRTGGQTDNVITTFDTLTVPHQSLTLFNSKTATGNWQLRVQDLAGQDVGTLNSWSLQITTQ